MKALIKPDFNNLKNQPEGTSMTEGLNLSWLADRWRWMGVSERIG